MILTDILKKTGEINVSDVILSSNVKPSFKINGNITFLEEYDILDKTILTKELLSIMNEGQKKEFKENLELDFSINLKGFTRFRVNVFMSQNGIGAVFRPIKIKLPLFEELGLPKKLLELTGKKHGLLLVTGSVGSGKTTTLASLIDSITLNSSRHIVTVEDPIEYIYDNNKSLVEQREVGVSTKSFENGLKYALRQASDVIMIGEMRDLDTFRLALRAAETGNLVIATLHTSGAARTVSRIIDMFPGDEKEQIRTQLSESLIGVIWQKLLKTKDGKDRVLASELLVNNSAVSNMIRKGVTHQIQSAIETGASDGMYTMQANLEELKEKGKI